MEECVKHSNNFIMSRRTLLQVVIITLLPAVILAVCPQDKYGENCEHTCHCEWENTLACDSTTGKCRCEPGYTGSQCEADIDECWSPTPPCDEMNMYCQNTLGSYDCICQDGFQISYLGNCVPCPEFTSGENCSTLCDCGRNQSFFCDGFGTCICVAGWTGQKCDKSVDDCIGVVCPQGTDCEDGHLSYVCKCSKNSVLIEGRCQEFHIDMVTLDTSPGVGELVDVYVLYEMPTLVFNTMYEIPNIEYKIVADGTVETEICSIKFEYAFRSVTGLEPFTPKLNITRNYNYYFNFYIWFTEAKEIPLRVVPTKGEHDELVIVFDVRSKTQAEIDCLVDLSIENVGKTIPTAVKYKRQSYNSFEVKWNPTKECRETPKLEWKYYGIANYRVTQVNDFTNVCLVGRDTWEVNIDDLILKAGESALTDHRSVKEIVPRGTLDLSPYMICVRAYVHNNKRFAAGVCGFIQVVPSYIIVGQLYPNNELLVWARDHAIVITADFKEPDKGSRLLYEWACYWWHEKNTDQHGPCYIWWRQDNEYTFKIPVDYFKPWAKFRVTVVVSLWHDRTVKKTAAVHFDSHHDRMFLPMIIKCEASCDDVIGADKNVVLSAEIPFREDEVYDANLFWSVEANDVALPHKDIYHILGYRYKLRSRSYNSDSRVFTRSRSLKPGVKYRFILECTLNMKTYWRGEHRHKLKYKTMATYVVEIEAPPKGDGCEISPKAGEAVFTRFTVECKNYVDTVARLPLSYKLFQLELLPYGYNKYDYILIAYSGSSIMENITLTSKSHDRVSTVKLSVEIKNVKGTTSEVPLTVELTTLDQNYTIGQIGNIEVESGGQEDARVIKNIATVISAESTASFSDKVLVRNDLLSKMNKLDSESTDSIEHVTNVLDASVEKQGEIETSGLDRGMTTAYKLAKYIGKLGTNNFERTKKVALTQVNALSRLLYVASVTGESIGVMNETEVPAAKSMKDQNIQHSMMATTSFGNIADIILGSITTVNESITMSNELMDFIVALKKVEPGSSFNVESDEARFYLPTEHSGVLWNEIVESELEVFKKNPFGWTASNVHGNLPVVKVNLVRQSEKHALRSESKKSIFRFSKPADVFLNYNASTEETTYSMIIKVGTQSGVSFVQMSSCVLMAIKVSTEKATVFQITSPDKLKIMVKAKYTNFITYFDNLADEDMVEMPLSMPTVTKTSKGILHRDESLFFLPQLTKQQLKRNYPFYRMKISMKLNQIVDTAKLQRVDIKVNLTDLEHDEPGEFYNVTIKATPHVMSCLHFDETTNDYLSDQCAISMYSNLGMMYCRCVVAAAFTGSVLVLPRLINPFDAGLFLDIFDNPLVVSIVLAIWLIYFALISWARFKDKQDEKKRAVTVLDDNREDHSYVYLIGVKTGWTASAGTSSNVFIYLKGTFGQSENHVLQDPVRRLFESGAENWFMLATKDDVGELISVVVWTDFSGAAPSWFLSSIYVVNLQTNESWVCPYNNWISVHFDTAQLLAEVPAFLESDYYSKWKLRIMSKVENDIRNEHLWFGIIAKTSYDKFTRVRRLTTGLSLLQALMILNLVFFGIEDKEDPGQFIEVLDQKIHLTSVIIGLQTSFIIFLLGVGISLLFNRVAPYPKSLKPSEKKLAVMQELLQRKRVIMKLQDDESESSSDSESEEDEIDNIKKPVDQQARRSITEQKPVFVREPTDSAKKLVSQQARKSVHEQRHILVREPTDNVKKPVDQQARRSVHEQRHITVREPTDNVRIPVGQKARKSMHEQRHIPVREPTDNVNIPVGQKVRKSVHEQRHIPIREPTDSAKKLVSQQARKSMHEQRHIPVREPTDNVIIPVGHQARKSINEQRHVPVHEQTDNVRIPIGQQAHKSTREQRHIPVREPTDNVKIPVDQQAHKSMHEQRHVPVREPTDNVNKPVDHKARKSVHEQRHIPVREPTDNVYKPVGQQAHKSINEQKPVPDKVQKASIASTSGSNRNQSSKNEGTSFEIRDKGSRRSSSVDLTTPVPKSNANSKFKSEAKEKPANAPFMLPPWFIYVTWILLAAYNIFLSYYIMLYGLSLGYEKSVDWVLAFFTGFLLNIFLIQPTSVAFMVLLLVFIFKQGHTIKEHAPVAKLNEGIMLVQENKSYNRKYKSLAPKGGCKAPLHTAQAKSVLERLARESLAREMLRDLFLYTIFMMSVLLVTYGNMNVPSQYLQTQYTKSIFLGYAIYEGEEGFVSSGLLDEVKMVEDMWEYIKTVVAPQMIDKPLVSSTHDMYLLGTARLRQVRSQVSSECGHVPYIMRHLFNEKSCAYFTYLSSEESNTYEGTWDIVSNISKDEIDDSPYVYRSQKDLNSAPFIGQHGLYSGGGYVITFGRDDLEAIETKLTELYNSDWIDQHTRCLFVEFTLYNPGSDHFTNVIIAFEFDNFGALFPYASIRSANLFNENRRHQTWLQLSEGFMVICVTFYTINEIQVLLKNGIRYFTNLWSFLEVATIVLTCAVGVLFFLRYAELVKVMKDFQKFGHSRFLNFDAIFEMHEFLHTSLATLGAVVIFKMLKVTSFNPFVVISIRTFTNARADFFGMALITVILIFIFGSTGKFLFGSQLESYMSIDRSILSILFFILADTDYESLVSVDAFLGRLYFVVVIMTSQYIIVNIFCSILEEGFELTRYMAFHREQEILKYMLRTLKLYAGFGPRNVSSSRPAK